MYAIQSLLTRIPSHSLTHLILLACHQWHRPHSSSQGNHHLLIDTQLVGTAGVRAAGVAGVIQPAAQHTTAAGRHIRKGCAVYEVVLSNLDHLTTHRASTRSTLIRCGVKLSSCARNRHQYLLRNLLWPGGWWQCLLQRHPAILDEQRQLLLVCLAPAPCKQAAGSQAVEPFELNVQGLAAVCGCPAVGVEGSIKLSQVLQEGQGGRNRHAAVVRIH